ncbi:oxidoreductase [Algoriphagus chordae]|uniref:NAD(P)-dependent dehydrogenase (Short-subunit alcohol dehydrogenase family) n=1 Tax=Algoriphagus chordae TaxID=237019 RepID=A0A2W7R379_9BACT|nr:oxidoreductase [Algoriphagus chordae]PZX54954.1 NAD(P)-dependent dehydrogenase (short-subunit alcohol dehydrogenase family) [Algoriphagus chordae]
MSTFTLDNVPPQNGKIAIVTGANSGLGYETALALAKKGATVILASRNLSKAQDAMHQILLEMPNAALEIILLDLNSLQSIENFAKEFSSKYDRLDLLIENAGIMMPPLSKTKDGFESQLGVNYLAHFHLTNLLFPIIKETAEARIVTLSSLAHQSGKIDFDNLNAEKSYSKWKFYAQSKLACLMFAYELQRRIDSAGIDAISLSAHPGFSDTNLGTFLPSIGRALFSPLTSIIGQGSKQGALPTLRAALDPEAKGGEYYGPSGFRELKGDPVKVKSSSRSHDLGVAAKLWSDSEELTGKTFEL